MINQFKTKFLPSFSKITTNNLTEFENKKEILFNISSILDRLTSNFGKGKKIDPNNKIYDDEFFKGDDSFGNYFPKMFELKNNLKILKSEDSEVQKTKILISFYEDLILCSFLLDKLIAPQFICLMEIVTHIIIHCRSLDYNQIKELQYYYDQLKSNKKSKKDPIPQVTKPRPPDPRGVDELVAFINESNPSESKKNQKKSKSKPPQKNRSKKQEPHSSSSHLSTSQSEISTKKLFL